MIKGILILISLMIVGLVSYGLFIQEKSLTPQKGDKRVDESQKKVKLSKLMITKRQEAIDSIQVDKDVKSSKKIQETKSQPSSNLGEDIQDVSYEQIENDTSLSDEEKEIKLMDKMHYESENGVSNQPLTEEEMLNIVEEDLKNGLITN